MTEDRPISGRVRAAAMLRGRHLIVLDIVSTIAAFLLALGLRFDAPSALFDQYLRAFWWVPGLLIVARVTTFLILRLYQRAWRYASVEELVAVTGAVVGSSVAGYGVLFVFLAIVAPAIVFPPSGPVIDTILMLVLPGPSRLPLP